MCDKEIIKGKLKNLVEKYQEFIATANKNDISEEAIRTWINNMLSIFGWNVQDTNQVLQERTLGKAYKTRLKEIESSHSRPDYILINGKIIKAFIDAKDLKTDIFIDKTTAFQVRSYAWSANVPCSFASNFEQFVIFDCRFKPNHTQAANYGAINLHSSEYIENFDILYEHLYRDNIKANKLEQLYSSTAIEGEESLDDNFNSLLTDFRLKLANALVQDNAVFKVNEPLLNYYVQVILDRIIFVRVCESRGIEQPEKLKTFKTTGFWNTFKDSCYMEFYEHYDGAMFERDKFFQQIILDNSFLIEFIDNLYYPHPYKFDVIPVNIIAQIYEDFLSRQLVIKNNKVEEELKSEYVKEKGAVSTPQYIIEAICKNALELQKIASIDDLFNIKILDPACGSGGFLISCFELISQRLIEIYKDTAPIEKYSDLFVSNLDRIYLTVDARREIIKNCLYGIDLDEAAVEVSKMSLALKVIDDNDLSVLEELGVFGDKILREIHRNIKLGNTLVDTDIALTPDILKSIKPFDIIGHGFENVFNDKGGFDYIVGNPPYVETKHYKLASPIMHKYIKEKYKSFAGKADLSIIFIERCLSLLNANGKLGFIVQKRFFKTTYGKEIRNILSENNSVSKIIDFKTDRLFPKRMTYVAIMILTKAKNSEIYYEYVPFEPFGIKLYFENPEDYESELIEKTALPTSIINNGDSWSFESYKLLNLITQLKTTFGSFGKYANLYIKDGIQVLWKKAYHLVNCTLDNCYVVGLNGFGENVKIELAVARPIIYNKLFYCFMDLEPHAYGLFPYAEEDNKTPIPMSEMKAKYPFAYEYLTGKEKIIKENVKYFDDPEYWHIYTREHNHDTFYNKKIIIPMTAYDTIATCSLTGGLYMDNANVWFIKINDASDTLLKAVTAIINSTVFSVFAKAEANPQSGGYYKFNKQFLFPVPFPSRNIIQDNNDVTALARLHDEIKVLQDNLINCTPNNKDIIRSALLVKWNEIDNICYNLYELNDSQRQLVHAEGRTMNRVDLLGGV